MTAPPAAGGTWTWAPRGCTWRPRSAGWPAGAAGGSGPRPCPGPGRLPGSPATSRTWWPTWPSAPTRPPSPGCCAAPGRRWPRSWSGSSPSHLDDARLEGLYRIGVDEVSYRKGHRYLTVVADHDRDGAVVWAGEGKSGATLERFFDTLGPERTAQLQAASMDLHGAYAKVTRARAPQARVCADPFHIIKLANAAVDEVRRAAWNSHPPRRRRGPSRAAGPGPPGPRRPAGQEHPLGAAERPRQLDRPANARRSPSCAAPVMCCSAPGC